VIRTTCGSHQLEQSLTTNITVSRKEKTDILFKNSSSKRKKHSSQKYSEMNIQVFLEVALSLSQ